jgi:outer membrane lipoprotein SlyB
MVVDRTENVGQMAAASFAAPDNAHGAIEALRAAGFDNDQLGVIASTEDEHLRHEWIQDVQSEAAEKAGSYTAAGGLLAGILGGAVALVVPGIGWAAGAGIIAASAAGGAFGGGLWGPMVEMGLSKERIEYLDERLQAGEFIITVHDSSRAPEAQRVLEECGGSTAHHK